MKLYFLTTIFLVIITSRTNALNCIDVDEFIEIDGDDFTLPAVQEAIENLIDDDTYGECFVKISVDYLNQRIEISFDMDFQLHQNNLKTNQEMYVVTSIQTTDDKGTFDPAEIHNFVEFACDYADECDRHFVLKHLEWLFEVKYDQLVSAISPLLTSKDQYTGLCFNYMQNKEEICSDADDMCFLFYSMDDDESEGGCDDTPNEPTELALFSHIRTVENIYQEEDQMEYQIAKNDFYIDYRCRTNNCNNQATANLIKKAVKDYYNMSSVYKALKVKIEEDLEEEHTTTSEGKTVNSTNIVTTTTSNTNTTNNIAKLLDISIIMIIFNACLILFS